MRTAPIVRFQNVAGHSIRERDHDGLRYFSRDATIEFRPESEHLNDRQRERQAERIDRLSKDPRFVRLPDRAAAKTEDEKPMGPEAHARIEAIAAAQSKGRR